MSITTKRGDHGKTGLFGGKRVLKSDSRIELIGSVDEVQALLGMLKLVIRKKKLQRIIETQQKQLYKCMAELAGAQKQISEDIIQWTAILESFQEQLIKKARIQNKFVLPGKNAPETWCHIVRTRIRFLERLLVAFSLKHKKLKKYLPYINRLSDFFFVVGETFV